MLFVRPHWSSWCHVDAPSSCEHWPLWLQLPPWYFPSLNKDLWKVNSSVYNEIPFFQGDSLVFWLQLWCGCWVKLLFLQWVCVQPCAQGKASWLTPALPVCTSWPCGIYRNAYYCLGNVEILCPFGILLNLRNKDIGLWGINSYSRGTGEGAYFNHRLSSEPSFMPHSLSNSTSWEQEHEVLSKKRTYLIFLPQRFGALLNFANSV